MSTLQNSYSRIQSPTKEDNAQVVQQDKVDNLELLNLRELRYQTEDVAYGVDQ